MRPRAPTGGEIVPYSGPAAKVLDQLYTAEQAGRVQGVLSRLDHADGQVTIVVNQLPESNPEAPKPRSRFFAEWHIYYLCFLAPFAIACLGAVAFTFVYGLIAFIEWAIENAQMIGTVIIVAFVCVLVFLGALAKARHGYPDSRRRH